MDRPHCGPIFFVPVRVPASVWPVREMMCNLDATDIVAHTQVDFTDLMGQNAPCADLKSETWCCVDLSKSEFGIYNILWSQNGGSEFLEGYSGGKRGVISPK